ncbi:MAG: glycoside hydrolase, partial [Chloroflexi bacterium]|nr:glycoside hydrolase [Chloroflexota bacterium]
MPLHVAFLWHMHQPCYIDPASGVALLPWTRLHATLNYLHMAEVLWAYPKIQAVVNLVPSLTDQLRAYARGDLTDRLLLLATQDRWSGEEVNYLRSLCFHAPRRFIEQHPRYQELWAAPQQGDAWGEGDTRDLLVWFHLAWTDAGWLEREESLRRLIHKERGFSRGDLADLLNVQARMLSRVLPLYRALEERGQVELSTSPYYHPILPLLVNTTSAHEASPGLPLPRLPLRVVKDAAEQVRRAVVQHEEHFGRPPRGLWPSEGAVSQEALAGIAGQVKWIASDEAILA